MAYPHPAFQDHPFPYDPNRPRAVVLKVVDGDTLDLLVDHGFRQFSVQRIRLRDVNAPEIRGPERPRGIETKEIVERLVFESGRFAYLARTDPDDLTFGRFVASVFLRTPTGEKWMDLGMVLIGAGVADAVEGGIYHGGG